MSQTSKRKEAYFPQFDLSYRYETLVRGCQIHQIRQRIESVEQSNILNTSNKFNAMLIYEKVLLLLFLLFLYCI